jgi:hypothetical protein
MTEATDLYFLKTRTTRNVKTASMRNVMVSHLAVIGNSSDISGNCTPLHS